MWEPSRRTVALLTLLVGIALVVDPLADAARSGQPTSSDDAMREHSALLVETDDGYRLVYEADVDRGMTPGLRAVLSYTGVLLGAVVLARGPVSFPRG